jgi:serine-type D-Ala-D-Ala endopeptidase (penicillin-binding protein 7)
MVNHRKLVILLGLLFSSCCYAFDWPNVTAKSWLVADESGKVIQSSNPDQQRSIASISKLMTVMVILDTNQSTTESIGKFTRQQLIDMALVHSDNRAAQDLCDNYPGGKTSCVRAMNVKAQLLGMSHTSFIEPTGLSVMNVSTARDLIRLVQAASAYPEIVTAASTSEVKIKIRKRWLVFRNTNPIIGKRHKFIVSKTGYINASGGCIVLMLDTDIGKRTVIVLGSKNTHTRIPEAEFIFENTKEFSVRDK